jgi:hypothetical protein
MLLPLYRFTRLECEETSTGKDFWALFVAPLP